MLYKECPVYPIGQTAVNYETENGVTTVVMIRGEQGRRRRDYSEGLSLSPHAPVMSWHVNLAVVVDGGEGPI